jgi:hypothetical protein
LYYARIFAREAGSQLRKNNGLLGKSRELLDSSRDEQEEE